MKHLLCAVCVGGLYLGACRPLQYTKTVLPTRAVASTTRTFDSGVTLRTPAHREDWPATEAPAVTAVPTLPASITTDKPAIDKPETFSMTVTPLISRSANYELELTADKFLQPLYLTHAADGSERLFVVEQGGVIWIVHDGKKHTPPFIDLSGQVGCCAPEQGLLGLAFHPNYSRNGYFFVHYSNRNGDTIVQRFVVSDDPNRAEPSSASIVLTHSQPYRNHNGGQISFGPDGYLYVGLGDGGLAGDPRDNGQNLLTWLGAILRVDVDNRQGYAVPPDNPFLSNDAAATEIWIYGLRNPWRFSFDRLTGDLYIGDVGQNDWEEIDFQAADSSGAENYGWSVMEGDHCYQMGCDSEAYEAPITEYHHSDGGCSVTGGYVYRGENLKGLQGVYVYGDYCSGLIWKLVQTAPGEWTSSLLIESGLRISSFGEDESGEVYVVDHGGGIFQLKHASES